jgi:hypothetical protein
LISLSVAGTGSCETEERREKQRRYIRVKQAGHF